MKAVIPTVFLAACLVLAGCYSYNPVDVARPGMDVRAQLQADAAARRSSGMDDPIVYYDGTVVESSADSLALDVLVARSSSQFQGTEIRDTIFLPQSDVRAILERRISPGRTALVTIATGAAAVAIVLGIDAVVGGTGDDDNGDDGNPPTIRVPLGWFGSLVPAILGGARE